MTNYTRRQFIGAAVVGAAGLSCVSGKMVIADDKGKKRPVVAQGAMPGRPNVLVIITDQQHAGMLSCAGNPWLKTPNLDRLAAEGTRFEKAYSANPVCVPSRFTMFSGAMPSVIGMEKNAEYKNQVSADILNNAMGSIFKRAGYKTVYGGKTHLPSQKGSMGSVEPYGFEDITPGDRDSRDGLVEACEKFLQQKQEQPFLLVASFINPHDICYMAINAQKKKSGKGMNFENGKFLAYSKALKMPEGVSEKEFFDKYCPPLPANYGIPENEPEGLTSLDWRPFRAYVRENWTDKDWRMHRWVYARLTESVDGQIGRVLDALKRAGLERDTLVVFTSDHGDMDASHHLEHKSMPYEEAMRVPFIVKLEGVAKAGAVDREHLVSSGLDLIPTLCDFAGIQVPSELKGRSARKLAEGTAVDDWQKTLIIENENSRILHMGNTKYVVYADGKNREQFMDLEKDPGEMKNFAMDPAYKPQVLQGRKLLKEWYAAHGLKLDPKYVIQD